MSLFGGKKQPLVPAELVEELDRLGTGGPLLVGEYDEAEVLAVGVPTSIGAPGDDLYATPMDRADEATRTQAVAEALASLLDRGLAERERGGRVRGLGPLGLLQQTRASSTFLCDLLVHPAALAQQTPRVEWLMDLPAARDRVVLMGQRLVPSSGRTQLVLWDPTAPPPAIAHEVCAPPPGPVQDPPRAGRFRAHVRWRGTGPSAFTYVYVKLEGQDLGQLRTQVDDEQMPTAYADERQIEGVLANTFTRALAGR